MEGDFVGEPSALAGYTEVKGYVRIRETAAADLTGMECLERIDGFFAVQTNSSLVSLQGVERLTTVGSFTLSENAALTSLEGLGSLRAVENRVRIMKNPKLTSLGGLQGLEQVGENLEISGNPELIDLYGLSGVTMVVGTLILGSNDSMLDCTGLESLISTGSINVYANAMLATVDGLEAIATLGYQIRLTANPALTDVTALASGKVDASGSIEVKDNTTLPQCAAESLAAAVRPADFTGDEDVSGNLGTCP